MQITKEKNQSLIDAANLLGEFVRDNLPDGWTITVTMDSIEQSIELVGPDGEVVSRFSHDQSVIFEMCDWARHGDGYGDA